LLDGIVGAGEVAGERTAVTIGQIDRDGAAVGAIVVAADVEAEGVEVVQVGALKFAHRLGAGERGLQVGAAAVAGDAPDALGDLRRGTAACAHDRVLVRARRHLIRLRLMDERQDECRGSREQKRWHEIPQLSLAEYR